MILADGFGAATSKAIKKYQLVPLSGRISPTRSLRQSVKKRHANGFASGVSASCASSWVSAACPSASVGVTAISPPVKMQRADAPNGNVRPKLKSPMGASSLLQAHSPYIDRVI